jgi:hypothetical protein
MLKKGWFVQDSIEKTLENLIADSELEIFSPPSVKNSSNVQLTRFGRLLSIRLRQSQP